MKSDAAKEPRQKQIHDLIARHGRLTAGELAERLHVTSMTIRRDLDELQAAGLVLRVHGGAMLTPSFVQEQSFSEKAAQQLPEKRAIALGVVRLLSSGSTVYLDTGTTAATVAQLLPPGLKLQLYTNNLRAVMDLSGRQDVGVQVLGGNLLPRSPDLVGSEAIARLAQLRTDVALIGADAVDLDSGEFYAADAETAALSRLAQRQANRVIVLADHSKFGRRGHFITGQLGPGITLITDDTLPPALRARLQKHAATVQYAPVAPN